MINMRTVSLCVTKHFESVCSHKLFHTQSLPHFLKYEEIFYNLFITVQYTYVCYSLYVSER
jgi:hypothetical protein